MWDAAGRVLVMLHTGQQNKLNNRAAPVCECVLVCVGVSVCIFAKSTCCRPNRNLSPSYHPSRYRRPWSSLPHDAETWTATRPATTIRFWYCPLAARSLWMLWSLAQRRCWPWPEGMHSLCLVASIWRLQRRRRFAAFELSCPWNFWRPWSLIWWTVSCWC